MPKTIGVDVTKRLRINEIDDSELAHCIGELFPYSFFDGERDVMYSNDKDNDWLIKFTYSKKKLIRATARLHEPKISEIEEHISNIFFGPTTPSVQRDYMFSSKPMEGFMLAPNWFQLTPVPQNAPKAPYLWAEHPFVCEFLIPSSGMRSIDLFRRTRHYQEIGLLLNLIIEFGVRIQPKKGQPVWIIEPKAEQDSGKIKMASKFRQRGYSIEDHRVTAQSFSTTDHLNPLEAIYPDEYYYQIGIQHNTSLRISTDTIGLIAKFFNLRQDKKRHFTRSLFWFYQADKKNASSTSSAFISLVNAVESLLPNDNGQRCPTCGSYSNSISKKFEDFLNKYAPKIDQLRLHAGSKMWKGYKNLYNMRSMLVHGNYLFSSDHEIHLSLIDYNTAYEWTIADASYDLVRLALIEWLRRA